MARYKSSGTRIPGYYKIRISGNPNIVVDRAHTKEKHISFYSYQILQRTPIFFLEIEFQRERYVHVEIIIFEVTTALFIP